MFVLFKQPYRENYTKKGKLILTLSFGLFIFLFLFLFKPFNMSQIEPSKQFAVSLGYGFVTSFVVFVFTFLFAPFIITDRWTVGKNILWEIVLMSCIGIANFFFYLFVFIGEFKLKYFPIYTKYLLFSIWGALLVGSIPVTIRYLVYFNKKYKRALKESSITEEEIITWEDNVVIKGGNPKNNFSFNPKSIVYISSNDNYISVFALKGDVISKTHIRGTLKEVESDLKKNSQFFRCHKCFIVNLKYVDRTSGNIQNLKLILKPTGIEIPVSRACGSNLIKKIN